MQSRTFFSIYILVEKTELRDLLCRSKAHHHRSSNGSRAAATAALSPWHVVMTESFQNREEICKKAALQADLPPSSPGLVVSSGSSSPIPRPFPQSQDSLCRSSGAWRWKQGICYNINAAAAAEPPLLPAFLCPGPVCSVQKNLCCCRLWQ